MRGSVQGTRFLKTSHEGAHRIKEKKYQSSVEDEQEKTCLMAAAGRFFWNRGGGELRNVRASQIKTGGEKKDIKAGKRSGVRPGGPSPFAVFEERRGGGRCHEKGIGGRSSRANLHKREKKSDLNPKKKKKEREK